MKKKSCGVYYKNSTFYIISDSYTEYGVGVSIGPMFKLAESLPVEIGETVNVALEATREGLPNSTDFKLVGQEMLRFLGVRSWASLARAAKFLSIDCRDDTVTIVPHKVGEKSAYYPQGKGSSYINPTAEEIGVAVMNTLKSLEE